ncbi:unnamed protein product, partial [Staurois parvus]
MPVSASYQCPSVLLISAHQCNISVPTSAASSVPHISAHQCCLSVPPRR